MRQSLIIWIFILVVASFGIDSSFAQPKRLAPGVLKVIPATIDARDSYSLPLPLLGLESEKYLPNTAPALDTLHGQSKNVVFFRDVWQYEFGFLGLRQISLQLVGDDGITRTENVWYLVYRIRNTGENVSYDEVKQDPRFEHVQNKLVRNREEFEIKSKFMPHFYLNGWVKPPSGDYHEVSYRDQVNPEALRQIRLAEDKNRYLLDKVEMMNALVPKAKSVSDDGIWGVAIWRNVDPRIDFVTVQVRGLTNAYRIVSNPDSERSFKYRFLQLNFWRPGDTIRQQEDNVQYGIPLVDDPVRQIEICQRFRLPGPLIRGYVVSKKADQNVLVVEIDAEIQFSTFKSSITPPLDEGKLPQVIKAEFEKSGVEVPADAKVDVLIPEQKWALTGKVDGENQKLILEVEPQYWEPKGKGIRFINSLEHLWIYR